MLNNLLGHSPITASPPVNNVTSLEWQIPTKGEAEVIVRVWSASNGKQEKLGELRLELQEGQVTLEDAANPKQCLDLDLVNVLLLVAQRFDQALNVDIKNAAEIKNLHHRNTPKHHHWTSYNCRIQVIIRKRRRDGGNDGRNKNWLNILFYNICCAIKWSFIVSNLSRLASVGGTRYCENGYRKFRIQVELSNVGNWLIGSVGTSW
jgi:hypothetical protein